MLYVRPIHLTSRNIVLYNNMMHDKVPLAKILQPSRIFHEVLPHYMIKSCNHFFQCGSLRLSGISGILEDGIGMVVMCEIDRWFSCVMNSDTLIYICTIYMNVQDAWHLKCETTDMTTVDPYAINCSTVCGGWGVTSCLGRGGSGGELVNSQDKGLMVTQA